MGFLDFLNRVKGKHGPIDGCVLKDRDLVILVDNSTRMLKKDRWDEVSRVMGEFATRTYKHNKKGIDVQFLNQEQRAGVILKTKSKTRKLFKETTLFYGQPVGDRLDDLFDQYVQEPCTAEGAKRERDVLVITDGSPSDDLEGVLVRISKEVDVLEWPKSQLRIWLVQVGDDQIATDFLRRLKEDLPAKHNITDLVGVELWDGTPLTAKKLEGVLLRAPRQEPSSEVSP